MFVVNESTYQITVSRGDTGVVQVNFDGTTTNAYALVSVKESVDSTVPMWEKKLAITNNSVMISFGVDETDFDFGKYVWDLRVLFANGDVETPMNPAVFEVKEVVGKLQSEGIRNDRRKGELREPVCPVSQYGSERCHG